MLPKPIIGNDIKFKLGEENMFCVTDLVPIIRQTMGNKLSLYNFDGSTRWRQGLESQTGVVDYMRVNDVVYFKYEVFGNQFTTKVKYSDGSIIWAKPFVINSLQTDIKTDNFGNTYIKYIYCPDSAYSNCSRNQGRIVVSNKNDEVIAEYNEPKINSSLLVDFGIDGQNNLITLSSESINGFRNNKYVMRKMKFCGSNFSITAPQITGITEACPGEKVKLSTSKVEGVSYQWQKDGTNLPSEGKDAVQDVGISGVYTVSISDLTYSKSATSKEFKVNIRSLPSAEIKSAKLNFCQGDKTILSATTNGSFFNGKRMKEIFRMPILPILKLYKQVHIVWV
ncbi:MAG: hypothetical protein U5N85_10875 [Arcicella sp.]|nr:hypothetical protein [Arcicella sp.]